MYKLATTIIVLLFAGTISLAKAHKEHLEGNNEFRHLQYSDTNY
tara:strand:- start:252 stop:383 length:132 start_codon:yes stop_codon:yes gene_type:complete